MGGNKINDLLFDVRKNLFRRNLDYAVKVRDSVVCLYDGEVVVESFFGENITVIIPEVVSSLIAKKGFYEEGLTAFLIEYLIPGMTFIDIGAEIGIHSLLASSLVGDEGQVHSFEPTPNTFRLLQKNLAKRTNVVLNQKALWSESGQKDLIDNGIKFAAFNSFFMPRLNPERLAEIDSTSITVETMTVDEYVDSTGINPDFIKIDAESSEFEIIKGMKATIARYRPKLTVEVGDKNISGVILCKDLIQYLLDLGYLVFEYNNGEITEHSLKDFYEYDNLLFLPA